MKELTQEEMRTQGSITNIQVSDTDVEKALKLLQQGGIDVKGTDRATSSLEDFYFGLIGGGENA